MTLEQYKLVIASCLLSLGPYCKMTWRCFTILFTFYPKFYVKTDLFFSLLANIVFKEIILKSKYSSSRLYLIVRLDARGSYKFGFQVLLSIWVEPVNIRDAGIGTLDLLQRINVDIVFQYFYDLINNVSVLSKLILD